MVFNSLAFPTALLVIVVLMAPGRAHAGDSSNRSPLELDLAIDLPVTIGTVVLNGVPYFIRGNWKGPECGLECDPESVNALDRSVIGNDSRAAALASDICLASSVASPYLIGAVDVLAADPEDGWSGYGKDSLVIFETLSVNLLVNQLFKYTVRRPRPYVYDPRQSESRRSKVEASLSFYSGHTSTAFAAATSYSYIFTLRHPDSNWAIPVWIGTHALAAATGVLRVEAGKHFWTDVLVGALAGSAIGLLIPYLHKSSYSQSQNPLTQRSDPRPTRYRSIFSFGFIF